MPAGGVIYKAACSANRKAYIGQTADSNGFKRRKYHHLWLAKHPENKEHMLFHRAIAKHGADSFKWEILLKCNVEQLDEYETRAIDMWGTLMPSGYNMVRGNLAAPGERGGYKRKREPIETLPPNASEVWENGQHIGYCANHDGKTKGMTSRRLTLATKRDLILKWLDDVKAGKSPQTDTPRNERNADLPRHVYRLTDGRLLVHVGQHPRKTFKTIELALEYKETLERLE